VLHGGVCRDPRISRKLLYVALSEEFGGTPIDWKRENESDIKVYEIIMRCKMRKKLVNAQLNNMR